MISDIKISIILPSLNVVEYIYEAIKSVLSQSLEDIEVLCIDAGSDDGTVEIIKQFAASDKRMHYIPCDVRSYGYQVNMGIELSKGQYIGIVETDDYVMPQMYDKLYEMASEEKLDFIKADYHAFITQDNGDRVFLKRRNFPSDEIYNLVLCPRDNKEVAIGDWYNCQGIYNRDFIVRNNIRFNETPGAAFQDIGFLYQALINANRVMYIRDSFYRYRIDREGSSSNSGKGIRYAFYEYNKLVENRVKTGLADSDEQTFLFCRMAKSFISCYKDISPQFLEENISERREYYLWFKSILNNAISSGLLKKKDVNPGIWSMLEKLLVSEEELLNKINDFNGGIEQKLISGNYDGIVIFGAGDYGYNAYKDLMKLKEDIQAWIDNNPEIIGRRFMNLPIISPQDAVKTYGNALYVIANANYAFEMRDQLISLGIEKEQIELYR